MQTRTVEELSSEFDSHVIKDKEDRQVIYQKLDLLFNGQNELGSAIHGLRDDIAPIVDVFSIIKAWLKGGRILWKIFFGFALFMSTILGIIIAWSKIFPIILK